MRSDRHGRLDAGDRSPRRRPGQGWRARDRARFRQLVDEAVADLPDPFHRLVTGVPLEIIDVPDADSPSNPSRGTPTAAEKAPVPHPPCRIEVAGTDLRRIVLFRRPLESRARDRADLVRLIEAVLASGLADALGLEPPEWPAQA